MCNKQWILFWHDLDFGISSLGIHTKLDRFLLKIESNFHIFSDWIVSNWQKLVYLKNFSTKNGLYLLKMVLSLFQMFFWFRVYKICSWLTFQIWRFFKVYHYWLCVSKNIKFFLSVKSLSKHNLCCISELETPQPIL